MPAAPATRELLGALKTRRPAQVRHSEPISRKAWGAPSMPRLVRRQAQPQLARRRQAQRRQVRRQHEARQSLLSRPQANPRSDSQKLSWPVEPLRRQASRPRWASISAQWVPRPGSQRLRHWQPKVWQQPARPQEQHRRLQGKANHLRAPAAASQKNRPASRPRKKQQPEQQQPEPQRPEPQRPEQQQPEQQQPEQQQPEQQQPEQQRPEQQRPKQWRPGPQRSKP
jgi:hypothetical protein